MTATLEEIIDYSVQGGPPLRCRVLKVKPVGWLRDLRTNERHPSVKLLLKPLNGGRAFWSVAMRDLRPHPPTA